LGKLINEEKLLDPIERFGVKTGPTPIYTTNVEALRRMETQRTDALLVVDDNKKIAGVIEEERIICLTLLTMAQRRTRTLTGVAGKAIS
jgi:CBS-domain-containing membrane protein